jgi:predicted metal-dependent enzyme (double-stranded beta helix superfamily)
MCETLEDLSKQMFDHLAASDAGANGIGGIVSCKDILESYVGFDYDKFVKFDEEKYQKIKLIDLCTKYFDIYLICWAPYQETKIHDHPVGGCLMNLLSGELNETIYTPELRIASICNIKETLASFRQGPMSIHKIKNGFDPSVSIHVYAPPGYVPKFY